MTSRRALKRRCKAPSVPRSARRFDRAANISCGSLGDLRKQLATGRTVNFQKLRAIAIHPLAIDEKPRWGKRRKNLVRRNRERTHLYPRLRLIFMLGASRIT